MGFTRLSDREFWRLHEANRKTERYRRMRREMIEEGPRCAVCGLGYLTNGHTRWDLQYDHRYYRKGGKLIFGRETKKDGRLRCPDCHTKGLSSDADVADQRVVLRWRRGLEWLARLAWRVLRWLFRLAWKGVTSTARKLVKPRDVSTPPGVRDRAPPR